MSLTSASRARPGLSPEPAAQTNVAANLAERAQRHGWTATPAFLLGDRVWSHGEVHDRAARAATVLGEHGVRAGDRVLLVLPDSIGWVLTFLAVARLGATVVLVNPDLTAADHAALVADCTPAVCVSTAALEDRFDRASWLDVEHLLARSATAERASAYPVAADHPLYVQYTSGTTGEPKGTVHTHGDLPIYFAAIGRRELGIDTRDVTLSVSKLFYAYGFGNAFCFPLYSGSVAVLIGDRPAAGQIGDLVHRHRVSLLYAVPSAFAALTDQADPQSFTTVRGAVSAGETLPRQLGRRAADLIGAPIYEQIGSTEAGHAFCTNGIHHNRPGTVGRPVLGFELDLRDSTGAPVADGSVGELWVRGPTVLREYLNRPTETAKIVVDGWLYTRDLASRGPDGTYRHVGRVDDMEMVGGITVSPLEIEKVLGEHPAVREVAVAAIPDLIGATKLRAFVVPVTTVEDSSVLESELLGLARSQLAAFKVPRSVQVTTALPRTTTGKLRRHLVRTGSW